MLLNEIDVNRLVPVVGIGLHGDFHDVRSNPDYLLIVDGNVLAPVLFEEAAEQSVECPLLAHPFLVRKGTGRVRRRQRLDLVNSHV
jgi:hypothetical protein